MIKKYFKFLSNGLKRKKNTKTKIKTDKIDYEIVYSNNYIDSAYNLLKYYDLIDERNLDVERCIENADSYGMSNIISTIKSKENFKELLDILSNIIIKVNIDVNGNWRRLCRHLSESCNIEGCNISKDMDSIYFSISLNTIRILLNIETTDTELIEFTKDIAMSYYDISMSSDSEIMYIYQDDSTIFSLGFDSNISIGNQSIFYINNSLIQNLTIIAVDENINDPYLSKLYYTTSKSNNIIISGSSTTEFNELIVGSVTVEQLLSNTDCNSEKLVNLMIEKYKLHDIDLMNIYNSQECSYDDIDELV